ncbi:MAG: hypothetical protein H3C62_02330 [Gemmatimonadaceae bacterium]|nr:hypothetical protein [Gemmatimonadaceae bacterium]
MTQLISYSERLQRHIRERGDESAWEYVRLRSMALLWQRSHRSVVVTYTGRHRTGSRPSILAQVFGWLRAGSTIETRYLSAGLPPHVDWRTRERAVRQFINRGLDRGTFTNAEEVVIPSLAYRPSRQFFRTHDVPRGVVPIATVAHLATAVEAALRHAAARASVKEVRRIYSESALRAQAAQGRGMAQAGMTLGAIPDLVIELADGRRIATELISRSYRNQRIVEKLEGLGHTVDFVGTSTSVARRFARVNGTVCAHF